MAFSLITSRQIEVEKMAGVTDLLFLGSNITMDGDCSWKLEYDYFMAGKLWQTYTVR